MKIYTLILCLVPVTGLLYIFCIFKRLNLKDGGEPLLPDYGTRRFVSDLKRSLVFNALAIGNVYLTVKLLQAALSM